MDCEGTVGARIVADGKGFRVGGRKFYVKGLTYGPFAPTPQYGTFPSPERVAQDLELIRNTGANVVRLYQVPPRWFLDALAAAGLHAFIDVPWPKHLCFAESPGLWNEARRAVRQAVMDCKGHPAVFAYSVVNEIPADIVRWSGARRINRCIDELVSVAKAVDPECLCTFANYPPTEYLRPTEIDFYSFNVYLHDTGIFRNYLARLQMIADAKPLVLSELGMDGIREPEEARCAYLGGEIEAAFRGGAAGTIVFSFTDDWHRGGLQVEDWQFGITTRDRVPKPSYEAVRRAYQTAPLFPLPRYPKVSVVLASYNGARTLKACLESLEHLNYPDYEVLLVDDGSTDNTAEIAGLFKSVRLIQHGANYGLSVARNTGIAAATGEIIAFTDSDCRVDEDWLHHLVQCLIEGEFRAVGGHNFLPPEDSPVAAAVMASPGGPAHVMLTDREAEHIPGCNMAFFKWALESIGGFDPVFHKAGDDVDVCWRLQQRGYKIGFSPGGFVWHYRRSTVGAYLKQQEGYGAAEALLQQKHPEYFNSVGRSIWRGRIYTPSTPAILLERSVIYHGPFGGAFFQTLYTPNPSFAMMLFTALEYHLFVTGPLFILSVAFPVLLPLAAASLGLSLGVCALAASQAHLPPSRTRPWSRPLVALLHFLQPIVRGAARYRASLTARTVTRALPRQPVIPRSPLGREPVEVRSYWSQGEVDRYQFIQTIDQWLQKEGWQYRLDSGWAEYDFEVMGNRWGRIRLTTVSEGLDQGRRNFRVRLAPRWSLFAKVVLGGILGAELVVLGLLAPMQPWAWMLLLSVPLLWWLLEYEQWSLQERIGALVDDAAASLNLIKLDRPRPASRSKSPPPRRAAERNPFQSSD